VVEVSVGGGGTLLRVVRRVMPTPQLHPERCVAFPTTCSQLRAATFLLCAQVHRVCICCCQDGGALLDLFRRCYKCLLDVDVILSTSVGHNPR
jgi:hypothetical protein